MRIEGSSYLPVPGTRRPVDIAPVQQVVLPNEDPRKGREARSVSTAVDESFEDALMQVSVPRVPHSRIAMLYEVQRLAQGPMNESAGGRAFQAAVAYDVSVARRQMEQQQLALPSTRV